MKAKAAQQQLQAAAGGQPVEKLDGQVRQ